MGQLSQLQKLVASHNSLEGKIPTNFTGCTCLKGLYLNGNNLIGKVSVKVGSLGKLQHLIVAKNQLTKGITSFIGNLSSLIHLSGSAANQFNGPLSPNMFHTLPNLQEIYIADNQVSGPIPPSITNAFILSRLEISINYFTGQVPSLGKLQNLLYLTLEKNNLGDNSTDYLKEKMLEYLYMQGNSLQGIIPSSLASLKCLKCLDLSRNCLSGSIPTILQNISFLEYFNVTFNILDGEVPIEGVFGNASRLVVIGNSKLCGGISELHLPPCPVKGKKLAKFRLVAVIVSVVAFLLILSVILAIYWMRKNSKKPSLDPPTIGELARVSYQSLHDRTYGFSTTNLIGSGILALSAKELLS
ncbi:hypothetical protein JHK87_001887 [Glycine soja]|nr:hypothetical protein JHK87_001887 [Glycine soja]